jgi:drug/metabolite transporter (DMT)-like permease
MIIGDALALVSAVVFAAASIGIAKAKREPGVDSGVLLSIIMTGAMAAFGWLLEPRVVAKQPVHLATLVAWFAASGLLATVWGRITMFKSVHFAGVIRATTVRRLTPFFSMLLAWLFLGDSISALAGAGMGLMAGSFALVYVDNRDKLDKPIFPGADIPRGYMFGVLCAMLYAASYVARKRGLDAMPDPYFGALVGSTAALVYFLLAALLSPNYRASLRAVTSRPERWQMIAALCISGGQILQFVALTYTTVGRVAIINSAEIFISSYLAVIVFKTENRPSPLLAGATLLATAGIILVTIG